MFALNVLEEDPKHNNFQTTCVWEQQEGGCLSQWDEPGAEGEPALPVLP